MKFHIFILSLSAHSIAADASFKHSMQSELFSSNDLHTQPLNPPQLELSQSWSQFITEHSLACDMAWSLLIKVNPQ